MSYLFFCGCYRPKALYCIENHYHYLYKFFLPAVPANSVYLELVTEGLKPVHHGEPVLELLDLRVPYLDESAAFYADEVVVVLLADLLLIPGLLSAYLDLFGYPGFAKEIQISLDRGESDLRMITGDGFVEFSRSDVSSGRQEDIEDHVPLLCLPQALVPDVGRQYLFSLRARHIINDNRYQQYLMRYILSSRK